MTLVYFPVPGQAGVGGVAQGLQTSVREDTLPWGLELQCGEEHAESPAGGGHSPGSFLFAL